jgi:type III restriction enzyme
VQGIGDIRVRPIVLVQVERTGREQRGTDFIHSEDVREHLIQRLNVPAEAIAVKSSEKDDIEGIDLLDEGCPIEWIITKSALQEGWDCPFAYILVSLNNTASAQSMTQLVGRVLRQPDVTKTAFPELNESYVYCLRKRAQDVTREVKAALEKEGYEGDAAAIVDCSGESPAGPGKRMTVIKTLFSDHYRTPFEGRIYLPRFCVKNGRKDPEALDYYRHLVGALDEARFDYAGVDWDLTADLAAAKDLFYRISLAEDAERVGEQAAVSQETDEQVTAWLAANLPFDYLGHKQLQTIVRQVAARLYKVNAELAGKLALVKFPVREKIAGFIERELDLQTKAAFEALFDAKKLCFYLECIECRFEIPPSVEVRATRQLAHANGDLVRKSLYDFMPEEDLNEYEKSVALEIDGRPQVLWWYRNLVGPHNFSVQGYRRSPIYPDFVVQEGKDERPAARVLVVESKGKQLKGNEDTNHKRSVANYFERAGRKVSWQKLGEEFADHTFRFQVLDEGDYADRDWRAELKRLLDGSPARQP